MKYSLMFSICCLFLPILIGQNISDFVKNTIRITSLKGDSVMFQEFKGIKEKIGNSRIVLMGEATHIDGSTNEAKASLVTFLEKEMGFRILAFETGYVNGYYGNILLKDIKVPIDSAKYCYMQGGWFFQKYSSQIFNDIRSGRSSLEIVGFDRAKPKYSV